VLLIALSAWALPAQARPEPASTLTLNIIDPGGRTASLEIEHAIYPWLSVHGGLTALIDEALRSQAEVSAYGLGPEGGLRLFLLGDAPHGLWIGPSATIAWINGKSGRDREQAIGFAASGMAGLTVLLFDRMILSLGGGVSWLDLAANVGDVRAGVFGVRPRLRASAGFAF
jgi:hypothetical protein